MRTKNLQRVLSVILLTVMIVGFVPAETLKGLIPTALAENMEIPEAHSLAASSLGKNTALDSDATPCGRKTAMP